ncbi:pentatricopeptide repeat domain-containing protein [Pochonia chlamydosporia 170]|uniref:Pentatricopeptide repeat domain-containing protein n=1 Tax=Pochonia chlamydosporia 170 TaxID=1380566 RepID=A0A179FSR5_METCM|nr:pentatricopeptide repeat domain-containing protein [Pochonia chlamydosporia 170]OAQ68298.1 pentatricopeptide repeat domain-containing protein [Pochonia chlamydosporia 170]
MKLPWRTVLEDFEIALGSNSPKSWTHCALSVRQNHGYDGVWQLFGILQKNGLIQVLANHEAQHLRDEILTAALDLDSRLTVLIKAAHDLLSATGFQWPELYMRVVHYLLCHGNYERSVRWHLQLTPKFPPSTEVFGALISSFVVDPSPNMQSNLTALYVSSTNKQLYDHIIPVLFAAGHSKLARLWRKKLLIFGDYPKTSKSRPFLRFLSAYYPNILQSSEELQVSQLANRAKDLNDLQPAKSETDPNKGQYSDAILARWFASTWASVELAINLAQRLGLRVIGPRSLQSLALREYDAKMVATRIAHIENLGITISSQMYCKALVFFAKQGEDALLKDLLACDIHPDEFDDTETRQMLMAAAVREQNWQVERLLQGIEWAIESDPSTRRLHALLDYELGRRKYDKARQVLDRMEALKVNMSQQNAAQLLERTFIGLGKHPTGRKLHVKRLRDNFDALVNRAIDVTRRVALHDVAVPLKFWSLLLQNLGRVGRLAELEQLSMEVIQLYTPTLGGLIPVHPEDLPPVETRKGKQIGTIEHQLGSLTGDICPVKDFLPPNDHTFRSDARSYEALRAYPKERQSGLNWPMQPRNEESSNLDLKSTSPWDILEEDTQTDSTITDRPELSPTTTHFKDYIPADLPIRHRQHPIQRLFTTHLQRSIVRWGFDHGLKSTPSSRSLMGLSPCAASAFDVASGIRLLALLRDQGIHVDVQAIRATIVTRFALGQVPTRRKDRSRDRHELSIEHLKVLFDEAWGSEILPSPSEIARQLEQQKPQLWSRYTKLYGQSFDEEHKESNSATR